VKQLAAEFLAKKINLSKLPLPQLKKQANLLPTKTSGGKRRDF